MKNKKILAGAIICGLLAVTVNANNSNSLIIQHGMTTAGNSEDPFDFPDDKTLLDRLFDYIYLS